MGRVDCVHWPGCTAWFWSHDHREPHFHVACPGKWEIRVFFGADPPAYDVVMRIGRIPRRALREFLRDVAAQRETLYREWDKKVSVVDP